MGPVYGRWGAKTGQRDPKRAARKPGGGGGRGGNRGWCKILERKRGLGLRVRIRRNSREFEVSTNSLEFGGIIHKLPLCLC